MPAIHRSTALASALCLVFALSACSKPKVPDDKVPPDPQATTAAPTSLNQAIQQPIDQAKAVREATEDEAKEQRKAIDDATNQ